MIEVDIVVPVFKGLDATRRCLDSVMRFSQRTSFEIVVINDASPEPAVVDYLEQLRAQQRITLIHNPVNRGFVCSANLGMMQHPDRDICLLNSDTEVHGDWLDRLRRSAYALEDVGTVTPFSNNATICSYPCFCEDNELPDGWSLSGLDGLCAELNAGQSVEIPTAVGFCMYVTRRCLEQTGYFDEVSFKRGYGEENDFCRRASATGFGHRLTTDTFVYHQGSVSFGHERVYLGQQAMAVIESRYPDYGALIAAHVAMDPARMARRRVDLARLLRSPKPRLLLITHKLLGGTEKHIQDLAQLLESDYETLILRPGDQDHVILKWGREGEEFQLHFRLPAEFDDLSDLLKVLGCGRIHFHHLIGFPPLIATLPARLAVPYDYTVHDHFAICPQFNLTSVDGRYCGEPDEAGCNACLAQRPAPWRLDIASWRAFFSTLLRSAARVFVPSQDTLERHRNYLPDIDFQYLPHPELQQFRVLVLGRLSAAKGGWQLEYCARDAKRRKLSLFFYVLGSAEYGLGSHEETVQSLTGLPLAFSGSYEDSMLSILIAKAQADVIYFPAQGPETYSYTLSAALSTDLPIVAPGLGAFSERLAEYPRACLISWDTPPAQVNHLLLQVIQANQPHPIGRGETKSSLAYLDRYRVAINRPDSLPSIALLETVHRFIIPRRIYNTPLEQQSIYLLEHSRLLAVFDDLVGPSAARNMTISDVLDWKNHLLSEVLRLQQEMNQQQEMNRQQQEENRQLQLLHDEIFHYRGEIDQQQTVIEDLKEQLAVRDTEIHRLNSQFSSSQQQIVELYASTSWKITAPLRWMRTILKSICSGCWTTQPIHGLRAIIRGDRRSF